MNRENPNPQIVASKQHFDTLDGLRGVAALAVVIFHFMEWIYPNPNDNFIGHGFLAVDFFFCLSGFVIGYAYDSRIGKMGVWEFFKSRLIRLHPLVILGSVLGLLEFFLDPFAIPAGEPGIKIILLFLGSLLLIPLPLMESRGFNLFYFNAPSWSLFWEYIANIFYALVLCRLSRRILLVVVLLSAVGILWVSYRAGNLLGGWSGGTFFDGAARVAFSFSAGLLIYRFNWIIKNRIGFIGLAVLLSLAFLMPGSSWNWLTEALLVIVFFPLIVSLGAGTVSSSRWKKVCRFSGNISYPLYMTHYAFIWIFGNYFTNRQPSIASLPYIIIPGVIFLVLVAYLVMNYYDIPIRRYFTQKRLQKESRQ
ncbi:MAG TPA: acyltransferase [Chitinophagaceae bacterium]|nr:acyltransferase [Chitinophagaceae bacterium]